MSASSLRRLTTVTAAAAALAVAVPSPALAGDLFFSKSSGIQVSTTWLEVGELPPAADVPGNAHFGDLYVEDLGNGRARVFGTVHDVECDEGTTPQLPAGGHGEPAPADGPCQLLGTRFVEGGQVTFTVDKKLTTARLTGTLAVGSGHGDTPGSPAVDITWTGVGDTYSERQSGTFVDEYGTWTYRYDFTGRDAVVTSGSRIGPMVFDDEPGESSESLLGRYRSSDRQRS
ncbi:hypothetical protein SAMN05660642_04064 [Geodermatophilus siccatus]|uniref:Htaa protein n=1 Tax=Geodermatophilus siccatus TaxID=1137991 RepID=A0A1G9YPQ0_9ACTN|nr:hypothetical protein [Geodermatophilus siccatus]SDN10957.1 hypothetical protein SAMN05660642_04064 [Geodermatophilus siccatus]